MRSVILMLLIVNILRVLASP